MRILRIHNRYQIAAGEDGCFESEVELLRSAGHEVTCFERDNNEIKKFSPFEKASLIWNTIWSRQTYYQVSKIVAKVKPEIAHIENTVPLISPSVYHALKVASVPIVQTLHNFRFFCVSGTLHRQNKTCEQCLENRSHIPSIVHGCYRGSRAQTIPLAITQTLHRKRTYLNLIDAYILLTEFNKRKFIEAGFPQNKMFVKPNFLDENRTLEIRKRKYALFVGRLSPEKGVQTLIEAWSGVNYPLMIVGDGPSRDVLADQIRALNNQNITLVGPVDNSNIEDILSEALFMVIPSEWYEGFPRVVLEAYSCSVPVLASRIGSLAELVYENETGLLFKGGDANDLNSKARQLITCQSKTLEMGNNARSHFKKKYTAKANYEELMSIYEHVYESFNRSETPAG